MKGKTYFVEQMEAEYIRGNMQEVHKFSFSMRKAYIMLWGFLYTNYAYVYKMYK